LPAALTGFVGREREVTAVTALLRRDGVRLVTLTGPGGVGKTRLALRVADATQPDFADGASVVELAPVTDPDLVAPTIAHAIGITDTGDRPVAERIAGALRDRELLLVLDNFEHVVDAAPLVAALLASCTGLKVLATSRGAVHISGEHEFPVPPLALPEATPTAERLGESEAVRLFVERARAADSAFTLTGEHVDAVAAICARLDGLPLAIELAAAKSRLLPPPALFARLAQRLPLLSGGPREAPARLRTMRNAIAWSYDLLLPEEQALFRRLAVFAGGFTLGAADSIANALEYPPGDTFSGIESLADQSMVRRLHVLGGEPRFGMLETVREFALELLAGSGEEDAVRDAHAAWCLAFAEAAAPHLIAGVDTGRWLKRLDAELDNVRAALGRFAQRGEQTQILRLLAAVEEYWTSRPYHAEVRRWLEPGLRAAPDAPSSVLTAARCLAAYAAGFLGDTPAAVAHAEEALRSARQLGDPFALGRAYVAAGSAWSISGDLGRATAACSDAVALLREAGATACTAMALAEVGDLRLLAGDVAAAVPFLDEALALHRQIGYPWGIAMTLGERAYAALAEGDFPLAGRLFAESIDVARAIGTGRIILGAIGGFAGLALASGQPALAARLLGAVEVAQEATGVGRIAHTPQFESTVAATRSRLGEAAFAAQREAGRALSLAQAEADALALAASFDTSAAPAPSPAKGDDRFGLTPRERDVLRLVVAGKTDREIADALFVSRRTVTTHTSNIFAKLGVAGRAEAAALAVRSGVV
jgi:non-specific serine/threonine protein kinase